MARKRPLVILRKVSNLLKRSIFAKLSTGHIIPRLILLKKSRKMNSKSYHYRFLQEYEFSATSTPLIFYNSREQNLRRLRDAFSSLSYLCGCLGRVTTSAAMGSDYGPLALPLVSGDSFPGDMDFESAFSDDGSVDQRADRFIEKFYEEMRMQRRVSV